MSPFNIVQVSAMALAIVAYLIAFKFVGPDAAAFAIFGFLCVWIPLGFWIWAGRP